MTPRRKILVVAGSTATGKKSLALALAQRFGGEIVSADSRKVYRGLDIGTAKPSPEDRACIPHHLIDVVDPDEPFNAAEWVERAAAAVSDIHGRGRLPIISGGTGFYIRAFREGLSSGMVSSPEIRRELEHELAESGPRALHDRLVVIDPVRAAELHVRDTFRIMRAIEVYLVTGRTFTDMRETAVIRGGDYDYHSIGITMERQRLYERIDARVDDMIDRGLPDEVKSLLNSGFSRELTSLDTVGYKEWFAFIDGAAPFEECREAVKRNTRRYAKRQLTWFRSEPDIRWIDALGGDARDRVVEETARWLNA